MSFNKNIYWSSNEINGIANKWSWIVDIFFDTNEDKSLGEEDTELLKHRIYSIGSMPTKEIQKINTYQGGIRMTHPGRTYYNGDLEFEFNEDIDFNVSKIFFKLLNSRFANFTIMDEDYPYKDFDENIDKIVVTFFETSNGSYYQEITFYNCWVKEFEYLNNLETKNEEENLKCKAVIKYNYYTVSEGVDEEFDKIMHLKRKYAKDMEGYNGSAGKNDEIYRTYTPDDIITQYLNGAAAAEDAQSKGDRQ